MIYELFIDSSLSFLGVAFQLSVPCLALVNSAESQKSLMDRETWSFAGINPVLVNRVSVWSKHNFASSANLSLDNPSAITRRTPIVCWKSLSKVENFTVLVSPFKFKLNIYGKLAYVLRKPWRDSYILNTTLEITANGAC